jgi:hypothetical protein
VGFTEVDAYTVSDSEITVRRRQPAAHVVCASGSMDPSGETSNQNGFITCGGRTPEEPAAGAPASVPGPNGGHNKLDVGLHSHTPSGARLLTEYRPISCGQGIRQIEAIYKAHMLARF